VKYVRDVGLSLMRVIIMCELTPCGNCIIHSGPYSEHDAWGQRDTSGTGFRSRVDMGNSTATTDSRNPIECHTCGQVFNPVANE